MAIKLRYIIIIIIIIIIIVLFFSQIISTISVSAESIIGKGAFEYVTPCQWSSIQDFSEGLALIKGFGIGGGTGYAGFMNRFGGVDIDLVWDDAKSFSCGLAPVKKDGKWGYIDKTGKVIIPCRYDTVNCFTEGYAVVKYNDKFGYIDTKGNEISYGWDRSEDFSEGLALVMKERKVGFIDRNGGLVIPTVYISATSFKEGYAAVRNDKNLWGYLNTSGDVAIDFKYYTQVENFNEGYAVVDKGSFSKPDCSYINTKGDNIFLTQNKIDAFTIERGICRVWYWIDGKMFIKFFKINGEELDIDDVLSGHQDKVADNFKVVRRNKKWGVLDSDFKTKIPCEWEYVYGVSENIATVQMNKKYGFVDIDNNLIVEPTFEKSGLFKEGRAVVKENNKYGIIRITDDGQLVDNEKKDIIGNASPSNVYINNSCEKGYILNGYSYIDVSKLKKYGLNVVESNDNKNIYITKRKMKDNISVEDTSPKKESYNILTSDIHVYVDNTLTNSINIEGITAIQVEELQIYGTVLWDAEYGKLNVFMDTDYMPNEGITWNWITDPFNISEIVYNEGVYLLKEPNNNILFLNSDGNLLSKIENYTIWIIENGVTVVHDIKMQALKYINKNGEFIDKPKDFDTPIQLTKASEYPKLDIKGRNLRYGGQGGDFKKPYSGGICGYLDESGNMIIDYKWNDAQPFQDGTALVNKGAGFLNASYAFGGGKWGLIDTYGNYIVEPKWDSVYRSTDGNIVVELGGLYGVADGRGNVIIPLEYAELHYYNNLAVVENSGKCGVINMHNELVLPYIFDSISIPTSDTCIVKDDSGCGMIRINDTQYLQGHIFVDDQKVIFDTPPLIINDRTMVPVRAVFEKLGCSVEWNEESKTVLISYGNTTLSISNGKNGIYKDKDFIYSDMPSINYSDRVYIPLRSLSEAIGCSVEFDEITKDIRIVK